MTATDGDTTAALEISNIHIAYGRRQVIHDLGLHVARGETFGLIGLNGAGKTTLIKTVLGMREPAAGTVNIMGQDRHNRESKKQVAYLPERFEPPWFLRGMEFIEFSMKLYGVPFDREAARSHAGRLALDPAVLDNKVQSYSKGMRQKLGIMGTLLTGCPLLILDEPMSGLDPRARSKVKDLLVEARAAGRTVFLSSHILADMNEICDRVSVLHGGELVFTGTPEALRQEGGADSLERAFLHVIEKREAA